ncbi:MAG: hypothetical protein IJV91_13930 [Kiritimatiellae bacterium]|nr:hypothetical protein [Kiritimatiellia bacterium]
MVNTRIERLSPEEWRDVAESLLDIAPLMREALVAFGKQHPEAQDEIKGSIYDPDVFTANISAAVSAVSYVSMYAHDKCNFVILPDGKQ